MRLVHYAADAPWVGKMACPHCEHHTPAWHSSGISECFPHFYCDRCSNVLHREADKQRVYPADASAALLDEIAATLPGCPCGGHFRPGSNPKCPHCQRPFPNTADPVQRLLHGQLILLDGACLIRDRLYSYEVCIGSRPKYWLRLLKNLQRRGAHRRTPGADGVSP